MHFYRYFTVMNAVLPEKQHFVHQQASTPGIDQSNTRRMGSSDHGASNNISQSTSTCGPHSRRIPGLSREHHHDEWNGIGLFLNSLYICTHIRYIVTV